MQITADIICVMKNIRLTIEYDGTSYFGWQIQKNKRKSPTIQGAIEIAIKRVFGHRIPLIASGRTDTGVHALGQIANFKVNTRLTQLEIQKALNRYLPEDILIKEVSEVPIEFHARYKARRKWYRYTILTSDLSSVFHRYCVFHYPYLLDLTLMKKASKLLKGKHDFSRIGCGREKGKVREIYSLDVKRDGNFIYIDVIGNGFLYKMVRRLVGILIDVGRGKISLEDVRRILSGDNSHFSVQTAPANGLTLMKVEY